MEKIVVKSIVICKHGKLGYSASLRFNDSRSDVDISASNKYVMYNNIDKIVEKEMNNENNINN